MTFRNPLRVGAALLGGSVLAVAIPAFAAVSASSPPAGMKISIDGSGTVVARGAQAKVPFTITCPSGSYYAVLTATLSEKVGGGVASSSTYQEQVPCDNVPETYSALFSAQSGGKAFKAGTAAVTATFSAYTRHGYVQLNVDGPVKLVSK